MNKIIIISLLLLTSCNVLKKTNTQLDVKTETNTEQNNFSSSFLDSLFKNHLEIDFEITREYFPSSPAGDVKSDSTTEDYSPQESPAENQHPKSKSDQELKSEKLNIKINAKTELHVQKKDTTATENKSQASGNLTASEETEVKRTFPSTWIISLLVLIAVAYYFYRKKLKNLP